MAVLINNVPVQSHLAIQALSAVLQNPGYFGLSASSFARRGQDTNFTLDQVITVLNPDQIPGQPIEINQVDEYLRLPRPPAGVQTLSQYVTAMQNGRLSPGINADQFSALARELAPLLAGRSIYVDRCVTVDFTSLSISRSIGMSQFCSAQFRLQWQRRANP